MKTVVLFAQERFEGVVLTVEKPVKEMERQGRLWPLMDLLPCLALALRALGRREEAQEVIHRGLSLAAPEGFVRTFVKWGEPMRKLLLEALQRGIEVDFVQQLLSAFHIQQAGQTSERHIFHPPASRFSTAAQFDPLSEREMEVLQFLQSHLTIPEIAREMSIAPSTLRTHVRNIYLKLDVHGRIEALQKARDLTLI